MTVRGMHSRILVELEHWPTVSDYPSYKGTMSKNCLLSMVQPTSLKISSLFLPTNLQSWRYLIPRHLCVLIATESSGHKAWNTVVSSCSLKSASSSFQGPVALVLPYPETWDWLSCQTALASFSCLEFLGWNWNQTPLLSIYSPFWIRLKSSLKSWYSPTGMY